MFSKLPNLNRLIMMYLEQWFTLLVETKCFLEIDFALVRRIVSSSFLRITSEIEIFDAVDAWIRHKAEERSMHAKCLLLHVRFPLLSDCALKHILNKNSTFKQVEGCREVIEGVLNEKAVFSNKSQSHFINRYCSHAVLTVNDWLLEGCSVPYKGDVYTFSGPDYDKTYIDFYDNDDNSSDNNENSYKIDHSNPPIIRYSPLSNKRVRWANWHDNYDEHDSFCLCTFMDKIYLLGGCNGDTTDTCYAFDPETREWTEKESMLKAKEDASAVVFSGKIVVSGGNLWDDIRDPAPTTFVEAYDHISDSWSKFPSMNKRRAYHKSVAIRNKLFVVDELDIEVYDSTCKKFVNLKVPSSFDRRCWGYSAFIGNKIITHGFYYDIEKEEWFEETEEFTKSLEEFKCF